MMTVHCINGYVLGVPNTVAEVPQFLECLWDLNDRALAMAKLGAPNKINSLGKWIAPDSDSQGLLP